MSGTFGLVRPHSDVRLCPIALGPFRVGLSQKSLLPELLNSRLVTSPGGAGLPCASPALELAE